MNISFLFLDSGMSALHGQCLAPSYFHLNFSKQLQPSDYTVTTLSSSMLATDKLKIYPQPLYQSSKLKSFKKIERKVVNFRMSETASDRNRANTQNIFQ